MSTLATRVGLYSDNSQLPGVTGTSIQRQMASLRARLTARYKLHTVPGRPEELEANRQTVNETIGDPGKVVSLGYGCKTIRIRKHDGRKWTDYIDIQLNTGWHDEVYAFLDSFFGYVGPLA